jgi:hypothetical protein
VALLAAMRRHLEAAALLIDHAIEAVASREMAMGDVDLDTVVQVQALMAHGRLLEEAAAAAWVAGEESVLSRT